MKNVYFYSTTIGEVGIAAIGNKISNLFINKGEMQEEMTVHESPIIKKAYNQLCEYLEGKRLSFDLEYTYKATPFIEKVWQALIEIPYGTTCSYKEVADKVGRPKAHRAVGNANHRNPIPIFIPCHRVITHNKKLGGYGLGLDLKVKLLELESQNKKA